MAAANLNRRDFLAALGAGALVATTQALVIPKWLPPLPEQFSTVAGTRIGLVSTTNKVIAARMIPPLKVIGQTGDALLLGISDDDENNVHFSSAMLDRAGLQTVDKIMVVATLPDGLEIRKQSSIVKTMLNGGEITLKFGRSGILKVE